MRSFAAMMALGMIAWSSLAFAEERTATLETANDGCSACALLFKWSLKRVPGVSDVTLAERGEYYVATVRYEDSKVDVPTLLQSAKASGFASKPVE
jgi:hypothetical protein